MNINYLIIAHKNPEQLKRLILKLKESWTWFFVHIDKGVEIEHFKEKLQGIEKVTIIRDEKRVETIWGDISIVQATLNLIDEVLQQNENGFCVLMSGQDYPLKNNKFIYNFLFEHIETNFIDIFPFPGAWKQNGLARINKYKFNKSPSRGDFFLTPSVQEKEFYTKKNLKNLSRLQYTDYKRLLKKITFKRKHPFELEPFGGSQWWVLPTSTIQKIFDFHNNNPGFYSFHKYTLIPDELFFQSIIIYLNKYEELQFHPPITYVNWKRKSEPLPVIFKNKDFEELKFASESKLFARKFDLASDKEILDRIPFN